MRIANINASSLVNGDGCRLVIIFQGCSLNCNGCFSKELHPFDEGKEISKIQLVNVIAKEFERNHLIHGLTLSGGNPPEQEDMAEFLMILKTRMPRLNIWMWTGFEMEDMKTQFYDHLKYLNVIVTGKFKQELKCEGEEYYGSENQQVWRKDADNEWKKNRMG